MPKELPIIQKTYDLIQWYIPLLNRLPRHHRHLLGDRIATHLYELLEGLVAARFASNKLPQLEALNAKIDILRYQTRMLLDFHLFSVERYDYASQLLEAIGADLGGWIRQQRGRSSQGSPQRRAHLQEA